MSFTSQKADLEAIFKKAYESLNSAQKQAVDTIEGPVMVIAGPGTGKTQILTLRIANILLKTDTAPDSILALTFTESGAKAMRTRLHRYIGARAYQVRIFTFHGFAETLIRDYPDAYDRIIGGRPASSLEKIEIVESILDSSGIKILRPNGDPTYYVTAILKILSDLKKEFVGPDAFSALLLTQEKQLDNIEQFHVKGAHKGKVRGEYSKLEKTIAKNRELAVLYRQYEALLRDKKLYDFEDMITQTVIALESNQDMLRDLQEQYQYVLADEHQDVNGSQNKILELLASYHDSPNIFVVGDEKQAIYRFQGASLDNFLFFQTKFFGTNIISLTENYRSGQTVLDVAHSLIEVESGPLSDLRVPLTAAIVADSVVTRQSFSHQAIEDSWVVDFVKEKIVSGTPPEEISVIVRTNKEVEQLAGLLRKSDIAVEASADGDILMHPVTISIEALLAAVVHCDDERALFTVLHGAYWGLNVSDIVRISRERSYDVSLAEIINSKEMLIQFGLSIDSVEKVLNISTVLNEARKRSISEAPHRVLEYVLQASGFIHSVMEHDSFEGVRVIRRLYDEVESLVQKGDVTTLASVVAMFAQLKSYNLPLNAPYINTYIKAVKVMTAHKSKGLEFEVVMIPHLQDSGWGGGTKRNYFDIPLLSKIESMESDVFDDEKRLFYVAITRAKHTLCLSYSDINISGKEIIPTRLFDEIDENLIVVKDNKDFETAFDQVSTLMQVAKSASLLDSEVLIQSLSQRGFSATSLNNYLRNPWDYIYRNVLRIPEVQAIPMQFGTAVHGVLEYATKYYTAEGVLPKDTLIKQKLEAMLGRLPLSKSEFVRLHTKGMEVIYPYLSHIEATLPSKTKEELSIKVLFETGIKQLPVLPLTGKLDRIDIDANGFPIRVIDYKTGKPKTRNDIEGNTASSDGGYKRQLVFYALLLDLYDDDRYRTRVGRLTFVEPDQKGKIHEEEYVITDEEISLLKSEIITAVKDIVSGAFALDAQTMDQSEYASLARLLVSR
jgi:DNA helicase-2/ATP-dependent DNA helicase PcrA